MVKTFLKTIGVSLIILMLLFPLIALCADAVPQEVLSARAGIVRVTCENSDGSVVSGTGFAVGEKEPITYIVTNRHVIAEDVAEITVLCADGLKVNASIYLENESADLCVLKLSKTLYGLKPLAIEDTGAAKTGDAIYALGFPAASDVISVDINAAPEDVTVTDGIVSAVKTGRIKEDGAAVTLLQVNASLSGGNSGGPLLDGGGRVVGINTFTVTDAQNINAAVSAQALAALLNTAGIGYVSVADENAGNTMISVIMIAAGVFTVAVGAVWLTRLRKKKTPSVLNNLDQNLIRQIDDELYAILPVVEQVRALHAKGRFGFDICPQNIVMSRHGAELRVKSIGHNADGEMGLRPGLSARERYMGGVVGPWTDVYAVSSLLYTAITGRRLPPAFERGDDKPLFEGITAKYKALAASVAQGLAADISRRQSSLDDLSAQIRSCLDGYIPQTAASEGKNPKVARDRKEHKTSQRINKIAASVLAACLLLGGAALVNEINYSQTVSYAQMGEYAKARQSLKGVFSFYKDASQLSDYVEAGVAMEDGNYDAASSGFLALGSYRGAADMAKESMYRHAQFLMRQGRLADAKALLEEIGDYADAVQLQTQIRYQNACDYLDTGLYLSALEAFLSVDPYDDSAARIEDVKSKLYDAALSALSAGDTQLAAQYLAAIPGFLQSDAYARCAALLAQIQNGGTLTREEYDALLGCADTVDLTPYLMSDTLIAHYLRGSWQDDEGNLFEMDEGGGIKYNLPDIEGDSYVFDGGVLYMTQDDGSFMPLFRFLYVDLNTLKLFDEANGETYVVTRQ